MVFFHLFSILLTTPQSARQNHNTDHSVIGTSSVKKCLRSGISSPSDSRAVAMSDVDDPTDVPETPDSSLASTRSRRGPSKKTNSRFEALKKLKAAKEGGSRYEVRLVTLYTLLKSPFIK